MSSLALLRKKEIRIRIKIKIGNAMHRRFDLNLNLVSHSPSIYFELSAILPTESHDAIPETTS